MAAVAAAEAWSGFLEAPLTWSGLLGTTWSVPEEESSMATMRARLQALTCAAQAKDSALEDMQRRLTAALEEAEQGRAREAALKRRAEKAEAAEEALASQMAEVEAEAFTRITETNKLLAAAVASHGERDKDTTSQLSIQVGELQRGLQAALEEAAAWARRCILLEEEAEQGRVREAALERRAKMAEEAEEALASQMAELEAEAFTRITENGKLLAQERDSLLGEQKPEPIASRQVAELERRLAEAEEELEAVHAKMHEVEERNRVLEMRVAQVAQEGEKAVTLKRKQGGSAGEETVLALSLQDLAGFVKLKLWNPSSFTLTSPLLTNLKN